MVAHCLSDSTKLSAEGQRAGSTPGAKPPIAKPPIANPPIAKPLFVGIDVSKDWVDICDDAGLKRRVPNEAAALTGALKGYKSSCLNMVCEPTGGYERALMRVAAKLELPLRRVHPNRARAFGQATAKLAKTDPLDAQTLKKFAAFTLDEPPAPLPSRQTQELAAMVSRLIQLTDLRQAEGCRAQQADGARVKASIKAMLKVLDAQIETMQEAIDAFIAKDPTLAQNARLMRSCKGVGPKTAQAVLALLPEIGTLDRGKIAALVGVAPITNKSGSSINHASIKGGRKPLRDILFMAATSAKTHNPTFKVVYERLKAKGKPHKLALVAVMRKLIITLNAIIKSRQPFKNSLI